MWGTDSAPTATTALSQRSLLRESQKRSQCWSLLKGILIKNLCTRVNRKRNTWGVQYVQVGCRLLKGGWCFLVFTAASEVAKWLLRNLSEAIEWFLSIG